MADKDVLPEIKKTSARKASEQQTSSHISVHPLYTPADLAGFDYDHDVGYPGQFPYTRGVQTTMYRGRLWTMRQYAGMGDAEESNKRYKYLLANGTTGLSVAFDLPTQIGMDSDSPMAHGRGRQGRRRHRFHRGHAAAVRRHSAGEDHHLDDHQRHRRHPAGALYRGRRSARGAIARKLGGTVQNDILKEYIARGTYIYPPAQAMRIVTDMFAYAKRARAGVEHDFHQRLSHARGRVHGGAGSRVHAGQRDRVRAGGDRRRARRRRVRAASLVLL